MRTSISDFRKSGQKTVQGMAKSPITQSFPIPIPVKQGLMRKKGSL